MVQALSTKQWLCTSILLLEHYHTPCPPWRMEASRDGKRCWQEAAIISPTNLLGEAGYNARLIISTNPSIRVRWLRSRSPSHNLHNRLCHPSALSLGDTEYPMSAMMKSRGCSRHSRIRLCEGSMPLRQSVAPSDISRLCPCAIWFYIRSRDVKRVVLYKALHLKDDGRLAIMRRLLITELPAE